ncbi:MAG TPA: hypothetical protein VGL94_03305, partial [Ktedonobacteraceae bacterium]
TKIRTIVSLFVTSSGKPFEHLEVVPRSSSGCTLQANLLHNLDALALTFMLSGAPSVHDFFANKRATIKKDMLAKCGCSENVRDLYPLYFLIVG